MMDRFVLVLLIAASLVACDRETSANRDVSQNAPAQHSQAPDTMPPTGENASSMNPMMPPQKDLPSSRVAGPAKSQIGVQLTEYEILMPDSLKAGDNSLVIVNAGKENHNFVIEGNGVHKALPEPLTRGDGATMDVGLKAGQYTVYCPVDGHRGKGMSKTVTVQ